MKLLMLSVFVLGAVSVTSCKKDPVNPETPKITFDYGDQKGVTALTLDVTAEGTDDKGIDILVSSNYEWKVKESDIAEGITINPKTAKKGETTVNIKVGAFDEGREVAIKFELVNELTSATLTVKQAKKGDPGTDKVLFIETLPVLVGQNTPIEDYTGWGKLSPAGLTQTQVTYETNGLNAIRKSSPPSEGYGFSGGSLIFLNAAANPSGPKNFTIKNINVTGHKQLIFKLGAGILTGEYPNQTTVNPTKTELKLYAGYNGTDWAELDYTTEATSSNGNYSDWSWVSSEFAVADGTTEIFVKFVSDDKEGRFDDFQIISGGTGAVIQPEGEPYEEVHKSIDEVRAHYKGGATAPVNGWWLEGVVVSDKAGANVQAYQIAIVDGTGINSGVMVNYKRNETNPAFNVGDKVKVILTNATYSPYFELLQLADVLAADVTLMNTGNEVTPITITPAQLETGNYESMLIAIDDVEIIDKTSGLKMDGNIPVKSGSTEFVMRTGSSATFKNEAAPVGKGKLIGLGSVYTADGNTDYQVLPRTMADVEDMQDATVKQFGVNPNTAQSVGAAAGTLTFNVTGNVAWTVTSTDNTNFGVAPANGDGAGEVTLTYTENTSTENTREATITFTTTDTGIAEGDRVIEVTVTQAKASGGGGIPAGTVLYKETWGSFGSHSGVTVADYDKSGTTTYQSGDASSINYGSSGANVKVYNHPDPGASGYVAPSNGYEGFSGNSMLLVPKSSRGEVVKVEGVKIYEATSLVFSMGSRQADDKITVKYTFNNGGTGTFVIDTSSQQYESYWQKHTFQPVNVPTGATSVTLEFSAQMDSNIRVDDFEIKAN